MTHGTARWTGALAALALLGCPPPEGDRCAFHDAGAASLEIGTGTSAFVALGAGDELEVVHGIQGGWHVEVAARLFGVDPSGGTLRFEVALLDGTIVAFTPIGALTERRFARDDACALVRTDIVVLSMPDPPAVLGAEVDVRVVLEAPSLAVPLEDVRRVTIVDRL